MIPAYRSQLDRFESALRAWGAATRLGDRLGGGNRNHVREVRLGRARYAARLSARSVPALEWELDLLAYLAQQGLRVPAVCPTPDGRRHVNGLVLFEWLDGDPPATDQDWSAVAAALSRLHALTRHYPQRPGFRSTVDLLNDDRGGDVRLDLMPADAVRRCRVAWRTLVGEPQSVIHGDPGAGNIRISRQGAGIFDWDEARVDASILDLAALPLANIPHVAAGRVVAVHVALDAWEAANGWLLEPSYARRRLARLP